MINRFKSAGIINEPPSPMLYTDISMLVGMTYVYLLFMILPLYANLVKMDFRLLERPTTWAPRPSRPSGSVTVPLSKAGIIAGFMLVFIPCVGEFVIPSLLGGPENLMIGRVVWDENVHRQRLAQSHRAGRPDQLDHLLLAIYYHYSAEEVDLSGAAPKALPSPPRATSAARQSRFRDVLLGFLNLALI
ncbi:MAG: hypothetical protein R3E56_06680 [Burkholderiaceae bacterium]